MSKQRMINCAYFIFVLWHLSANSFFFLFQYLVLFARCWFALQYAGVHPLNVLDKQAEELVTETEDQLWQEKHKTTTIIMYN